MVIGYFYLKQIIMREAEQIIAKLINERVITGEEAIILLNACKVPQLFIPEKKEEKKWNGLNGQLLYNPGAHTLSYNPAYDNCITAKANSIPCGG